MATIKRFFFWVFALNPVTKFITHSIVNSLFIASSTLFFISYEMFGEKWGIFTAHPTVSEGIFITLLFTTCTAAVLKGIRDHLETKLQHSSYNLKYDLIGLASRLVRLKLQRFKESAQNLKSSDNVFKKITKPQDQINFVIGEFQRVLQERFSKAIVTPQKCVPRS